MTEETHEKGSGESASLGKTVLKGKKCTADLKTLGTYVATKIVPKEVINENEHGDKIKEVKPVPESFKVVSSKLSLVDATTLGEQTWYPLTKGEWTCKAGDRRFVVSDGVFEKLAKA